jgi:hypothetical protein
MRRLAVVGVQFKLEDANLGPEVTRAPYSINPGTKTSESNGDGLVVASRLPMNGIDIEFEELEEKTAPQSDTSYLDWVLGYS